MQISLRSRSLAGLGGGAREGKGSRLGVRGEVGVLTVGEHVVARLHAAGLESDEERGAWGGLGLGLGSGFRVRVWGQGQGLGSGLGLGWVVIARRRANGVECSGSG